MIWTIFKREFNSYFATPLAVIFLVVFWMLSGVMTFYVGGFFERGEADLMTFFMFHPWLFLVLAPALTMRLWAEERKSGTLELLLTWPVSLYQAVLGKFFAAWVFAGLALVGTLPLWAVVTYLGSPDHGVILAGYIGSWFMAGAFLALGMCLSSVTKNQIVAFILAAMTGFIFVLIGSPAITGFLKGWMPDTMLQLISSFSFLTHFDRLTRGVLEMRSVVFFLSLIGVALYSNMVLVTYKKAK